MRDLKEKWDGLEDKSMVTTEKIEPPFRKSDSSGKSEAVYDGISTM